MAPLVLLVQPPIHDFTAFDFFLYPLGLLEMGARLAAEGYAVAFVDALDRLVEAPPAPGLKRPTFRADGCGHFHRRRIPRPPGLDHVPRRFHRFGLPEAVLAARFRAHGRPAAAVLTCTMTWWYPGVRETTDLLRTLWPGLPVAIGGVYATLCPEHARRHTGADRVVEGGDPRPLLAFLREVAPAPEPVEGVPSPHALAGRRTSAAVRASRGCPRRCPYCAAPLLDGPLRRRNVEVVLDEIAFLVEARGVRHVAFYDDALLDPPLPGRKEGTFEELAEGIRARGLQERARFHCPNALAPRFVTRTVARLLRAAGFRTIRLGFETADPDLQRRLGGKVANEELAAAVEQLRAAGYGSGEVGVYLLAGLPGQTPENVEDSMAFVHHAGGTVRLAEYAPVPGTPLFERTRARSSLDLDEPLHHNKMLAAFRFPAFPPEAMRRLKDRARALNHALGAG